MTATPIVVGVTHQHDAARDVVTIRLSRSTSTKPWLRSHVAHREQVPDDYRHALAAWLDGEAS